MPKSVEKFKGSFFDREAVLSRVPPAVRKALSRLGAFVRRRARSSIRKRKKSAPPGQPPSSHAGLLKDLLFFAYEPEHLSVVVGPALLNGRPAVPTGPELLEFGGDTTRRGKPGRPARHLHYRGNPFMRPAFEAELPKVAPMFKSIIRG